MNVLHERPVGLVITLAVKSVIIRKFALLSERIGLPPGTPEAKEEKDCKYLIARGGGKPFGQRRSFDIRGLRGVEFRR